MNAVRSAGAVISSTSASVSAAVAVSSAVRVAAESGPVEVRVLWNGSIRTPGAIAVSGAGSASSAVTSGTAYVVVPATSAKNRSTTAASYTRAMRAAAAREVGRGRRHRELGVHRGERVPQGRQVPLDLRRRRRELAGRVGVPQQEVDVGDLELRALEQRDGVDEPGEGRVGGAQVVRERVDAGQLEQGGEVDRAELDQRREPVLPDRRVESRLEQREPLVPLLRGQVELGGQSEEPGEAVQHGGERGVDRRGGERRGVDAEEGRDRGVGRRDAPAELLPQPDEAQQPVVVDLA